MRCCSLSIAIVLASAIAIHAHEPRFDVEVMAVLSKAGCNAGACHGNATGKGGLKISLRGEDPANDYAILAKDFGGRRVNVEQPEKSLLLLKALGAVAHGGGVRFARDSQEYKLLHDWIAAGVKKSLNDSTKLLALEVTPLQQTVIEPANTVQLKVVARFATGETRDVTTLTTYETSNLNAVVDHDGRVTREKFGEVTVIARFLNLQSPVRLAFVPARPNFAWDAPPAANYIDEHVFAKLQSIRVNPSAVADDATFVRRVYLDCIGVLPTADEARSFVADPSPEKRARLIDQLLERPEFADFWALKWADLLRTEEKVLDARGVDAFHGWIRESIATAKPMDQFVRELIIARGSTYEVPPANYYRANRDPLTRAETTARLFLGVRLQCARCHNHPFDRWTQDDYYSWGAWFSQLEYQVIKNDRGDNLDKNAFNGEQIVHVLASGEVQNARTGKTAIPQFLGAATPELGPGSDRLVVLADWLASSENALFVRSQVNFVWYHLMGRGLVEPIDDVRVTNPASNPELFDALSRDFAAHRFDLRHLVRTILNSRTYQLASQPNDTNAEDDANFARAVVRRLTAEQLIDAQSAVLGVAPQFPGYPEGTRAMQVRGVRRKGDGKHGPTDGDRLLKMLGKPERLLSCECERSSETTLNQALLAVSDAGLQERLASPKGRIHALVTSGMSDGALIDELYWTALARGPSTAEREAAGQLLKGADDRFAAAQDLCWALLNAKEFVFRR
jgi:hypothetical protein